MLYWHRSCLHDTGTCHNAILLDMTSHFKYNVNAKVSFPLFCQTPSLPSVWFLISPDSVSSPLFHQMLSFCFISFIDPSSHIPVPVLDKYFITNLFVIRCEIICSTGFSECIQYISPSDLLQVPSSRKGKGMGLWGPRSFLGNLEFLNYGSLFHSFFFSLSSYFTYFQ